MPFTTDQYVDLITGTLNRLGPAQPIQIAQEQVEYEVFPRMSRRENVVERGGERIIEPVFKNMGSSAKMTRPFATDDRNIQDRLGELEAPWRHMTFNYLFEERLLAMNMEPHRFVDIVKAQRMGAYLDAIKLLESQWYGAPTSSADLDNMWGLFYWIVKNDTEGYTGDVPAGFTTVGGLTHANWKNYSAQYSAISDADMMAKLNLAFRKTHFVSPLANEDMAKQIRDQYAIYLAGDTLVGMEILAKAQNTNIGNDVAAYMGGTVYKGIPLKWSEALDADTEDPLYLINWDTFKTYVLAGEFFREGKPAVVANQHRTIGVDIDLSANFVCIDRRRNAVIHK